MPKDIAISILFYIAAIMIISSVIILMADYTSNPNKVYLDENHKTEMVLE